MTEKVHITPQQGATCEVHDWPTEGLGRKLILAMRERHGKGGVNVCVTCISRARGDAKADVARLMSSVPIEDMQAGDIAVFSHPSVAYGVGGYKVESIGTKTIKVSRDVRFSPTGPWHHQEHRFPREHLKEVFRLRPAEGLLR
jgi:hypothetical protein